MKKIITLHFFLLLVVVHTARAIAPDAPFLKLEVQQLQIKADWEYIRGAQGYNLYYAPYPKGENVRKIDLGRQNFLSTTLEVGDAYYIAVKAYNSQGEESRYSNIEYFILDPKQQAVEHPVFPNAQGFGVSTVAGRGATNLLPSTVCQVLNTNDSGRNSLRECLERSEPRMVIFKTGGIIKLSSPIIITEPYISIFGQTAPGDGIMITLDSTVDNAAIIISTHDVLMQHLRIRPGSASIWTHKRDALSLRQEKENTVYNVVIDHNSFSWVSDEFIDVWRNVAKVTFSNNILAEGLKNNTSLENSSGNAVHLGGEGETGNISFHHNLIAHSYQRGPSIQTSTGITDIISNINYGWVSRGTVLSNKHGAIKANIIDNLYIRTKETKYKWGDILIYSANPSNNISIYFKNNYTRGLGNGELIGATSGRRTPKDPEYLIASEGWGINYKPDKKWHSSTQHPGSFISRTLVGNLEKELIKTVGASLPKRDSVDNRVIEQLVKREGSMKNCVTPNDPIPLSSHNNPCTSYYEAQWPEYHAGTPYPDQDNDGIDDNWEKENGLSLGVNDALLDNNKDGYYNIENWIFSLNQQL